MQLVPNVSSLCCHTLPHKQKPLKGFRRRSCSASSKRTIARSGRWGGQPRGHSSEACDNASARTMNCCCCCCFLTLKINFLHAYTNLKGSRKSGPGGRARAGRALHLVPERPRIRLIARLHGLETKRRGGRQQAQRRNSSSVIFYSKRANEGQTSGANAKQAPSGSLSTLNAMRLGGKPCTICVRFLPRF